VNWDASSKFSFIKVILPLKRPNFEPISVDLVSVKYSIWNTVDKCLMNNPDVFN